MMDKTETSHPQEPLKVNTNQDQKPPDNSEISFAKAENFLNPQNQ